VKLGYNSGKYQQTVLRKQNKNLTRSTVRRKLEKEKERKKIKTRK